MNYKDNKSSIQSMHQFLRANYGRPSYCMSNTCQKRSKIFEWCKKTDHEYTHNPKDYLWLCRSCHRKYDMTQEKINQFHKNCWWKTGVRPNFAIGERVARAKVNTNDVKMIRKLFSKGNISKAELGRRYNMTQVGIAEIITRKTWRHI